MERYEAYKDSGVEWIGEIPERWFAKRIKSLIHDLRVGPFGSAIKTDDYCDEGVPLYTQETVLRGDWTISKRITNEKASGLQSFVANSGDYLITTRGTLGCVYELPSTCKTGIIHPCLMRFRINLDSIDGRFLKYALNDSNELIEQVLFASSSSTIPVLYSETFRNAYIAVPPIHHQQAIADYLDAKTAEIDSLVADCEREVGLLQEYRKAVISEAVTKGLDPNAPMKDSGIEWIGQIPRDWHVSKITRILDDNHPYAMGDGDHGSIKSTNYCESGVPFLRVQNLGWGADLSLENLVFISESDNATIANSILRPGDILFAKTGATIGKTGIVPDDMPIANTTSHVGKVTVASRHCPRFYLYVLTSNLGYLQLWALAAQKTTRPELSIDETRTLLVPIPPSREIEDEIARYLDVKTEEIDSLIAEKQAMVEKLREYRKSLISECVTGKIKVPGV